MTRGNGRGNRGGGGGNRGGGRGRGRGGGGGYRGGRGNGMSGSSYIENELDFNIHFYADAPSAGGAYTPRGRGRGGRGGPNSGFNSGTSTPNRGRGRGGYDSPRGRGRGQDYSTPRRGDWGIGASPRGRGRGAPITKPGTLSGLLYQERPLLRPIVFVPSVFTKVLFQEEEELIKPIVEDVDDTEQSHIPTADRVSRVFSGGNIPRMESDSEEDEDEEEIEEVNFDEVGKLFDASATTTRTTIRKSKLGDTSFVAQEQFTGFYIDPTPTTQSNEVDDLARMMDETLSANDEPHKLGDVQMSTESIGPSHVEEVNLTENLFVVDVQPTPVPAELAPSSDIVPTTLRGDDDDDVIVYVAPHPRNSSTGTTEIQPEEQPSINDPDTSRFTEYVSAAALPAAIASSSTPGPSAPASAPLSSFSFSFPETPGKPSPRLQAPPLSTPRQAKLWNRKRIVKTKKRKSLKSSFGAFGAMREEVEMHRFDPQHSERRRGDSDLEWGDTDDEDLQQADEMEEGLESFLVSAEPSKDKGKGKETEISIRDNGKGKARAQGEDMADDSAHGMDVDEELDLKAMKSFVGGLLGNKAGEHVTMDDVYDAELMRLEDQEAAANSEESEGDTSEDESEEDVMAAEEAMLISESLQFEDDKLDDSEDDSDDDDEDDDDDDLEQTPRTSFQARLERLREKSRSSKHADTSMENMEEDSDEDQADMLHRHMTWAEKDDDYIQQIQKTADGAQEILTGKDRKAKKALFRAIRDGDFYDSEFAPAKRAKDKYKDLPPELQDQWEKDRKAKAEYKKAREQARLEVAADPMSKKKGGKKGRKAMLAAAELDPTITVIPNRVVDMTTLVQQIRRFIADVGGPSTMSLPPTNKETRKNIHEMAVAFNLKSLSKGKGDARYTTLTKTTRSGINVNEAKVAKIVRRSGGMGARGDSFIYDKKGRGPPTAMPRHREGDEVGKAAPKLTQSNVGFRMLALMGWSEGTRIGFAGGLDAPLTAIIKNTKLGLGATK
ncbi:hypothetical protein BDN70DRAFT_874140 [Pholiota conissans]|uniref:Protein SQS1 n=1 Tax=Pholiota conissans TaxID=109636 RepID=A0A9P5Z7Y4_9AGAR|nr:hypothetical protein BDN70DRAFT_874140 [Pholiota conissans]